VTYFFAKIQAKYAAYATALLVLFTATSCSGLRQVQADAPLLVKNEILINGKPTSSDDDYDIMRQRPNRGVGNVRLFLSMHQFGERIGDNGVGNWFKNIGEAPAIYDSLARLQTAQQLGLHYFNLGYYRTNITTHETRKRKKVTAHYQVTTGPRYTIDQYALRSTSRFIDSALTHYEPLLEKSAPMVAEQIEAEQLGVVNFLKNNGYYRAKLGWVYFEVDTLQGPDQSTITCVVDPYIYGGDLKRARLQKITVEPTYSYRSPLPIIDSTRTAHGMDVLQTSPKFLPEFLDQQIFMNQGDYYNNALLRSTYKNLTSLGVFRNVQLDVVDLDSAVIAHIQLEPLPKRAVQASLEGLGNSGSIGLGGNFSWDNRNLFKGGELLRLSLGGSITEQRNSTSNTWLIDARELNTAVALNIPKLVLPENWLPLKAKQWSPKTEISAKASYQFRANEFNRLNLTANLDYRWRIGKASHLLTPAQLSFVQIDFNGSGQTTPFLFNGFQDLFFSATSYRFSESWTSGNLRFFLATELESGGHLFSAAGIQELAGTPLARYLKTSIDFRTYKSLVRKRELAFRTFIGVSEAWGTTNGFVPFEKSFFMGGSNDMRGWTAYHFGPGSTSETLLQTDGFFAAAPIKLLQSIEYRYTIQEALKGAVFLDAGNMWLHNKTYTGALTSEQLGAIDNGVFKWNRFYEQIGLSTGLGLRYDVEFFILRADLGMKTYHPGADGRSNWTISDPKWRDLNVSLGIGYPF